MKNPSTTSPSKVIIIPRPSSSGTKASAETLPQEESQESLESAKESAEDIPAQQAIPEA